MKFAVPTVNDKLTAHFGHCQEFAILEVEGNEIIYKKKLVPPPHEPGVLPNWLHEQGAEVIIAGGMGHRAIDIFNQVGIKVVTGAPVASPEELVLDYVRDTLVVGDNACGEGEGEGHSCGGH